MPVRTLEILTMHNPSPNDRFVVIREVHSQKFVAPSVPLPMGYRFVRLQDEPYYWPLVERPAPFAGRRVLRLELSRIVDGSGRDILPNGKYEFGFAAEAGGPIGQSYTDWYGDETLPVQLAATLIAKPLEEI